MIDQTAYHSRRQRMADGRLREHQTHERLSTMVRCLPALAVLRQPMAAAMLCIR